MTISTNYSVFEQSGSLEIMPSEPDLVLSSSQTFTEEVGVRGKTWYPQHEIDAPLVVSSLARWVGDNRSGLLWAFDLN